MPARNAARWLGGTLESIAAQSYPSYEVILVDDASTDGTAAIARAWSGPLRLVRGPGRGIVAALEAGRAALLPQTDLIARMDADDLMAPERLALQVAALEREPRLSVVASRVQLLRDFDEAVAAPLAHPGAAAGDGMGRYVDWLNTIDSPESVAREMFVESPVCHPAVMIRRTALDDVDGYEDHPWTEDYDLWLRLHLAGHTFRVLPEVLHVWRDHGARTTRTDPRCAPERFSVLKAYYLVRRYGRELRIWGAGRDGRRLARALQAEGASITAFYDVDPKKIGRLCRGAPVHSYEALRGPGDGPPIVTAVGIPEARALIREALDQRGYAEGRDYVCAA